MRNYEKTIAKGALFAATLCGAVCLAPEAKADPHTHDGFYLNLSLGLGYLSTSAEYEGQDLGTISGVTIPSAILLGGSVSPGIVIGGGFTGDYAPSPSLEDQDLDDVSLSLYGVELFTDIYPDPHGGLHFMGGVGFGALEATVDGNSGGSDPTGLILTLGAGYDWWVASEWSIGAMGRFSYAPLSIDDVSYNTIAPSLLATFTYH